jgi:hypothetical protein
MVLFFPKPGSDLSVNIDMKREKCVFTIVKNESFFLPIWLGYYKRFFNVEDIYILDHSSTDGSTTNLDCNVEVLNHELVFDHEWLKVTVQDKQRALLEQYQCVVFAEVDEILYSLKSLDVAIGELLPSRESFITAIGYEIMQKVDTEKPHKVGGSVMEDRAYWFRYGRYDKTLITKVPQNYSVGFHDIGHPKRYDGGVHLLHLHRLDYNLMRARHEERIKNQKISDDKGGDHNKTANEMRLLKFFNEFDGLKEKIPAEHKEYLASVL